MPPTDPTTEQRNELKMEKKTSTTHSTFLRYLAHLRKTTPGWWASEGRHFMLIHFNFVMKSTKLSFSHDSHDLLAGQCWKFTPSFSLLNLLIWKCAEFKDYFRLFWRKENEKFQMFVSLISARLLNVTKLVNLQNFSFSVCFLPHNQPVVILENFYEEVKWATMRTRIIFWLWKMNFSTFIVSQSEA